MKKKSKIITIFIIIIFSVILVTHKVISTTYNKMYIVSEEEHQEDNKSEKVHKNDNLIKRNIETHKNENDEKNGEGKVVVYISGAVKEPGILNIEKDKRLYDAVEKLGGLTQEADLNRVNLALKLMDEKHYIIPKIGEELVNHIDIETKEDKFNDTDNNKSSLVNINTATDKELQGLPGVGESTSDKIIKYREEKNLFKSIQEIKNVNGIGEKKYEDLKDLICV